VCERSVTSVSIGRALARSWGVWERVDRLRTVTRSLACGVVGGVELPAARGEVEVPLHAEWTVRGWGRGRGELRMWGAVVPALGCRRKRRRAVVCCAVPGRMRMRWGQRWGATLGRQHSGSGCDRGWRRRGRCSYPPALVQEKEPTSGRTCARSRCALSRWHPVLRVVLRTATPPRVLAVEERVCSAAGGVDSSSSSPSPFPLLTFSHRY
jgi:hypothetical protein